MITDKLSGLLLFAGLLAAQDPTVDKKEPIKAPSGQNSVRAPEHDLLAKLAGRWEITTKRTDPSGAAPVTSNETSDSRLVCDGLWLVSQRNPDSANDWYGLFGYDTQKKKYVGVRVAATGYEPVTVEGDFDNKTQTLTLRGLIPDASGKKQPVKITSNLRGDERLDTIHATDKDGKETVVAESTYRRAKTLGKAADAAGRVGVQKPPALPSPLPEHAKLDCFAGTWEGKVNATLAPGAPPAEGRIVETGRLICGGLFLWTECKGDFMNSPFEGYGIYAYDPEKKRYTSYWIDNMGAHLDASEGTPDKDAKVWTMQGTGVDDSGKPTRTTEVIKIEDADNRTWSWTMVDQSGKQVMKMDCVSKRQKK